ncbi:MAG: tRNA pseudouridine(55) synthase TruB, partial [Actinomycetota bacterium]
DRLISAATVAKEILPAWELTDAEAIDLGHGKKVATSSADAPLVAAIIGERLVAIVAVKSGVARVVTGFPHD